MPITIPHNRLDLWCDSIQNFFKIILLTINFGHFKPNFGHICPVQVNGGNFQVQDYVFLTSEMKSTLNFSLESILYSIFWPIFFFSHQMSAKPGSDLEPCRMTKRAVALHLSMMGVRYIRLR